MPARTCWPVLAVALVGALAGTPSAATAQSADTTRAYRYMMGTSVQVEALGGDAGTRRAAIEEAFSAIAEVDRLMSNYRDDSELAAINRAAWREPVRVSDPMLAVLQAGRTYGHILDARTLQPSDAALSVTILSRDGTLADAMSKAAFILGPEAGIALIHSTPGLAGVIAYRKRDGTLGLTISPSLKNAFHPVVEPATHRNDRH